MTTDHTTNDIPGRCTRCGKAGFLTLAPTPGQQLVTDQGGRCYDCIDAVARPGRLRRVRAAMAVR